MAPGPTGGGTGQEKGGAVRALTVDEVWGGWFPATRWPAGRRHRHEAGDEPTGPGPSGRPDPGPGPGHRGNRWGRRQGWGWGSGWGGPGGGPGGWWGGGDRPRSRPRRGDVRLAVLLLLAEQPMHGYQIITELTERSNGVWRPSPGSVYPTLQQLEDEGLVVAAERDGRRTFSLTDHGRATVEAIPEGRSAPWEAMAAADAHDDTIGLRKRMVQVAAAAMQVATGGSDEQIAQAERVLADAQRALYRVLSEEGGDG